ncbi:MAG: type II secretion system F family protein [Pseudomonadota bacterium]|nr:type II secretion system F family protein [Pseudomonadota bacterium]
MLETVLIVLIVLILPLAAATPWAVRFYTQRKHARTRLSRFVHPAIISTLGTGETRAQRMADMRRRQIQSNLRFIDKSKKSQKSAYGQIRTMLMRAGLSMSLRQFWILSLLAGLFVSALFLAMDIPTPVLIPIYALGALVLPKLVLGFMAKRRIKAFNEYFADAIDVMVRGMRSGLPVGECFNIIARESPDPVGAEFRKITDEVRLGLTLEEAVVRALERVPTAEMKFFSIVLAIQQQTGGNLADILGNISSVLRGRAHLRDKIKALSSEARASAMIIGALPFVVMCAMYLINPGYIGQLFTTQIGNMLLIGGGLWMAIGVLVMKQMTNLR